MGSDWKIKNLGSILTLSNGKTPPKRNDNSVFPVYGSNGLIGYCDTFNAENNTLIIGRVGSYCGSVYFSNKKCWVTDNAIKAYAKNNNIPKYLYYLLKNLNLNSWREGSGQPLINQIILKSIEFSVPSFGTQKAIAHILGTLDDKIELNRQMNETLEAMAQALFKSWFVDFDPVIDNALRAGNDIPKALQARAEQRKQVLAKSNETTPNATAGNNDITALFPSEFEFNDDTGWIPRGWKVEKFGDVSICLDNRRIPLSKKQREEKKPGTIPYHGATSVMDYINEWIFDDIYVLIGEDGSVIKDDRSPFVQYIWGKTWVNNHAHVLQGNADISTEHLMLFLQFQNMTPYITGAVQPKINQGNLNRIPFLYANEFINTEFSAKICPVYKKIRYLREQSETLTKLRDTLLPKLISGELRIADAEKLIEDL